MTTTRAPRDSWLAGLLSVLTTAAVVAVLALAVALAVVPRMLDGAALTVLTGSMVPTYNPGDVVVVRGVKDAATEVRVNDVVSFQPLPDDPTLITHRVISIRSTADGPRWITRGDANGADDEPLQAKQIKAEVVYSVPYVGHVMLAVGQHRSTVVVGAALALFAYAAWMVLSPDRRRRTADEAPAADVAADTTTTDPAPREAVAAGVPADVEPAGTGGAR